MSAAARRKLATSDPTMAALIERVGKIDIATRLKRRSEERPADAYGALLRAIVGQQLSTKAARTIYGRVCDLFGELDDEQVIEEIVAVRGLGQWTAEMFLIFHLERPDVLSGGDLGIRKAIQIEYGLKDLPTPQRVLEIGDPWRPNRSLASLYLWESLAAVPA